MKLLSTHVVKTLDLGVHDNLFGGRMLSILDETGAAYACEMANSNNMVTVCMDKVEFLKPVKLGKVLKVYGDVDKIGNTSITIKLEARVYNPLNQKEFLVCKTNVTFVRIDADGTPIPINPTNTTIVTK